MKLRSRTDYRRNRHRRVRRKILGTSNRPRLAIMVSQKHMYVQFVDDGSEKTVASAQTVKGSPNNMAAARSLGERAAAAAREKGISSIVVDRGGHKFHGRLKAIVDAVVKAGVAVGSTVVKEPEAEKTGDGGKPEKEPKQKGPGKAKPKADKTSKKEDA